MRSTRTLLYISIIFLLCTLVSCSKQGIPIYEVMNMDETDIAKISLDIPGRKGDMHSTTNRDEISEFITYLNGFTYVKIRGDAQSYMPKLAAIIYLYGDETESFIVPYGKEVMIDQHIYALDPDELDLKFFQEFYYELDH